MFKMKKHLGLFLILIFINFQGIAQNTEVFVQLGHSGVIDAVALSSDGKLAISGSLDNTLKLWEVESGREIRTFQGHSGAVHAVTFSRDNNFVFSGSRDNSVRKWDINSGELVRRFQGHTGRVNALAVSRDGESLFSASADGTVRHWRISNGSEIRVLNGHDGEVNDVAVSPINNHIATAGSDNLIKIWDISDGREIRSFGGHMETVLSLDFSPDARFIVSGGDDRRLKLWDVTNGEPVRQFSGHTRNVQRVAFSPDGSQIVSAGDQTLRLWNTNTAHELIRYSGHSSSVNSVDFSANGLFVISASSDRTLKTWSVSNGNALKTFTGQTERVFTALFTPDGQHIVTGGADDKIKVWSLETGREIRSMGDHTGGIRSLYASSDNSRLFSGSMLGSIKMWDFQTGAEISEITGPPGVIWSLAAAEDEKHILANGRLVDIETGNQRAMYSRDASAISPDGSKILAGQPNGTLILLHADNGEMIHQFSRHYGSVTTVAFSPDGRFAASGSGDRTIKIWDVKSGREIHTLSGHRHAVWSLAYSPDGTQLISGSSDYTLKLWDIASGNVKKTFSGHTGDINNVAFSPDRHWVISASLDGTTRIWDTKNGQEVLQFISFPGGQWVAKTPDGFYDSSEHGAKFLNVRMGNNLLSMDNFFDRFYRPDIVRMALEGGEMDSSQLGINDVTELPPEIVFLSPSDADSTFESRITIKAEITDKGGGIDEVRLYHNGNLISDATRAFRMITDEESITREFEVPLLMGQNEFRLIAFSKDRIESNPEEITITYLGPERESDLYILTIGIDEYQNPRYNLNYGRSDAEAIADIFETTGERIFRSVNVKKIFDSEAVRPNIKSAIDEVISKSRPEDTFIFYYAGHGVVNSPESPQRPDFFMALHDVTQLYGQEDMLRAKGISSEELREWIGDIEARRQLIVFDACQAGGALDAFTYRGAAEERAIQQLARSAGVAILASAESDQFATEFAQIGHGVFTYALLQGLRGAALGGNKSGSVTVQQLVSYINQSVPDLTLQYRGQTQYPVSFFRGQDFPLMVTGEE